MYDYFNFFFFNGGRAKNAEKRALFNKNWIALNTFYYLLTLLMGRFKYTLPPTMDARFLELCLLSSGDAGVAKVDDKVMNFSIMSGATLTPYGYYMNYQLADYNGKSYGKFIPNTPDAVEADSVLIWDNPNHTPPISRVMWYADRLTTIQASINACIANLKGTTIITCTKEQEKPIAKAWCNAGNGLPVIISFGMTDGLGQIEPKVITNPQTADILTVLQEAYDKNLAEFCVEFGINANGMINKLSGVSDNELQETAQRTQISLNNALYCRKRGIDDIINMFGVDAKIETNFESENDIARQGEGDSNEADI